MFDARTYGERRARLARELGEGLVLLLANRESPINYPDNWYPFRQDSTFLYLIGLNQPDLAAVLDLDAGEATVFGDELTLDDVVWTGPLPTLAERAAAVGIRKTRPAAELAAVLVQARGAGRPARWLPPYRGDSVLRLMSLLDLDEEAVRKGASLELVRAVVSQRAVKTPAEIAEIELAADTTAAMHLAVMAQAAPGRREAELAALLQQIAQAAGGQISFPSIVTVHGEILHNHGYPNVLESGRLLVCDAGAETAAGYAGDMTRTYPVDRTFTARQRDVYEVVLAAQEAACTAIAPGVRYLDVHLLASRIMAAGLKDLGLMQGDPEEAVAAGAHALFFPHGLGHMVGLDVHDMEDLGEDHVGYGEGLTRSSQFGLKSLRLARELQAGFVVTVEPGIYFVPELIQRWRAEARFAEFVSYKRLESYLDFGGVRIEETWLVTADGGRLLGRPVPTVAAEVEAVRAGGGGAEARA
jgi:Xaa-Pro aminopeptidase